MRIERPGFALRNWSQKDCASLAKNINNINIWDNVRDYLPHPYTEINAEEFITMTYEKPYLQDFAIEVDGKAVGGIGFVPSKDVERLNAEIGYWLGEEYWSRGIMSSAIKVMTKYIFANTEIIRLFATVYEYNYASMRALEKAGFVKLTTFSKAAIKNDKIIDIHYYELLKD